MTKYEGQYLIFNRRSKRLSFQKGPADDKTHLAVGQVKKGVVNGQSVDYWLAKMEAQKQQAVRA